MATDEWGIIDEIQHRRLVKKVRSGAKLKKIYPIRPLVKKVFEADGMVILSQTKGIYWIYTIW